MGLNPNCVVRVVNPSNTYALIARCCVCCPQDFGSDEQFGFSFDYEFLNSALVLVWSES